MLRFEIEGSPLPLEWQPDRVLLAGYTGREEAAVRHHIEELKAQGIPAPESTPAFYRVLPTLLRQIDVMETLDDHTCGEAEAVFLFTDGGVYVTLGSDHTDRLLEQHSVEHSKQLCPKPVSRNAWRLDETLQERWDAIEVRSWATIGGERALYQEGTLGLLMTPDRLFEVTLPHVHGGLSGMALFGGTVPTLGGALKMAERFEAELLDTATGQRLTLAYAVQPMTWLS